MPRISIGECSLYYEEHGSGEPLLLVPGLGGVGASFFKQIAEFSKHFRVVVHDHREVATRHPFATDKATLERFIDEWERGTLPKKLWTHGAHVGVAAYFAFETRLVHPLGSVR